MKPLTPERLWQYSCRAYARGQLTRARVCKIIIYLVYHAVLPYECTVSSSFSMLHRGLGVVVHPNTTVGERVSLGHNITLAAGDNAPGSPHRVVIEDDVIIGSNAVVVGRWHEEIRLCSGSIVGAGAVVTRSVPPATVVVSPAARELKRDAD